MWASCSTWPGCVTLTSAAIRRRRWKEVLLSCKPDLHIHLVKPTTKDSCLAGFIRSEFQRFSKQWSILALQRISAESFCLSDHNRQQPTATGPSWHNLVVVKASHLAFRLPSDLHPDHVACAKSPESWRFVIINCSHLFYNIRSTHD